MFIRLLNSKDAELIDSVVNLGTKNSKTLGHFPRGAFIEHANKGLILAAIENDSLCGYLLFRVVQKKQIVSITQLCISEEFRGKKIGPALLSNLCEIYSTVLRGISLKCREDYQEASKLWQSFGFKPKNKIRGRGKKETTLVIWWYDFGNPDLFSQQQFDTETLNVVIDANIIIKLRDIDSESDIELKSLDAPWIYGAVGFHFAPETYNEINRDKDKERANETREFIRGNFEEIRFKPKRRDEIEEELKSIIPGDSNNNKSDRLQLAECLAASFDYFITLDEPILSKSNQILDRFGLNIYRPSDLIIHLDKLKNFEDYASFRIEGANYNICRIEETEIELVLDAFLRKSEAEKKVDLKAQLLKSIPDVTNSRVQIIKDGKDSLGLLIYKQRENTIEIQVIRTRSVHGLSKVLFQQMLIEIIRKGLQNGLNVLTITEMYLSQTEKNILEELGFIFSNGVWKKVMFKNISSFESIVENELVRSSFNIPKIRKLLRTASTEFEQKILWEFERKLWPAKIRELEIQTYIIPIKPTWAKDLFDYKLASENLFGANASLIWSNENIYYRSVKPVSEVTPARILWYLSSGSDKYSNRKSGVIACSYLTEVHIGSAKELYKKFKNYGVYDWNSVKKLAKNDPEREIKALKFSFTEVFEEIIKKSTIDDIFRENNQAINSFNSPLKIKNSIFESMYNIGVK